MAEPERLDVVACTGARFIPRPFWRFLQWTAFSFAAPMVFVGALIMNPATVFVAALIAAGPIAAAYGARRRGSSELYLADGGLRWQRLGSSRTVPTTRVVGGHVARKFRAPLTGAGGRRPGASPLRSVHLTLDNGAECRFDLATQDDAERVMAHLGLDAGKRAVVAPLRGLLGPFTRGLLAFTFSVPFFILLSAKYAGASSVWIGVLAAIAFTVYAVRRIGFPRVVVGADGIRITGTLLGKFVSYRDIVDVKTHAGPSPYGEGTPFSGIVVVCKGGRNVVLPTIAQSADEERALVTRIRAGMDAYARGAADRVRVALQRQGRPIAAWREDLKRIAETEGGFREQAIGRDDVERVLVDPSAEVDQRLGAALALRGIDQEAGVRIREAAAACANVPLRVALEAAAEGELDEGVLEGALKAQGR